MPCIISHENAEHDKPNGDNSGTVFGSKLNPMTERNRTRTWPARWQRTPAAGARSDKRLERLRDVSGASGRGDPQMALAAVALIVLVVATLRRSTPL